MNTTNTDGAAHPVSRTYVTVAEASLIAQEVEKRLPPWFTVVHVPDDDLGQSSDMVWLKRRCGPMVGLYTVRRDGAAFTATALPEPGFGPVDYELGEAETVAEVVDLIAADLCDTYDLEACLLQHTGRPNDSLSADECDQIRRHVAAFMPAGFEVRIDRIEGGTRTRAIVERPARPSIVTFDVLKTDSSFTVLEYDDRNSGEWCGSDFPSIGLAVAEMSRSAHRDVAYELEMQESGEA